jgi:hypothetical protein
MAGVLLTLGEFPGHGDAGEKVLGGTEVVRRDRKD